MVTIINHRIIMFDMAPESYSSDISHNNFTVILSDYISLCILYIGMQYMSAIWIDQSGFIWLKVIKAQLKCSQTKIRNVLAHISEKSSHG